MCRFSWAIFNSYVKLPEGPAVRCELSCSIREWGNDPQPLWLWASRHPPSPTFNTSKMMVWMFIFRKQLVGVWWSLPGNIYADLLRKHGINQVGRQGVGRYDGCCKALRFVKHQEPRLPRKTQEYFRFLHLISPAYPQDIDPFSAAACSASTKQCRIWVWVKIVYLKIGCLTQDRSKMVLPWEKQWPSPTFYGRCSFAENRVPREFNTWEDHFPHWS